MQGFMQHLGNPVVLELMSEWMDLHGSGLTECVTPGHGREEMIQVITELFQTLRGLVAEHETLSALEHKEPLSPSSMHALLCQAQEACTQDVFPETMTGLCLLRRKLHAARLDLKHGSCAHPTLVMCA